MRLPSFILLLFCTTLWARSNVFIDGVDLAGVHEDYAERIVFKTKDVMSDKITFVNDPGYCDYILKISLLKEETGSGVVVTYKLLDPSDNAVLWSYSSIAYTPDDFAFMLYVFNDQFPKWSRFKFGVGMGVAVFPIEGTQVAPSLGFNAHCFFNNQFITLDLNGALGTNPLLNYGVFFSYAYMFDSKRHFPNWLHPYVGGGAGASITEYDPSNMTFINADVSLLAKGGLILNPNRSSTFYVFDVRLTYNVLKSLYVEDSRGYDVTDEYTPASFGLQTSIQVWW